MKSIVKKEVFELIKKLNLKCGVNEFKYSVDWYGISKYQKLSPEFIKEFKIKVYWLNISRYQKLSPEFIKEFKVKVHWDLISMCQKLSPEFIKEFKVKVYWDWISIYQKLSPEFIKEFKDYVNWEWISKFQILTPELIREFKDYVNWINISRYQKLTPELIKEFNLAIDNDNWLYKDVDFKREELLKLNLYEFLDENHIMAYKGIRSDRYSSYNFQYQYLKGNTYESNCDCTCEINSFGLSAWTYEEAENYYDELIIKVKININDIGRIVHDGGKLRCFKFEILD